MPTSLNVDYLWLFCILKDGTSPFPRAIFGDDAVLRARCQVASFSIWYCTRAPHIHLTVCLLSAFASVYFSTLLQATGTDWKTVEVLVQCFHFHDSSCMWMCVFQKTLHCTRIGALLLTRLYFLMPECAMTIILYWAALQDLIFDWLVMWCDEVFSDMKHWTHCTALCTCQVLTRLPPFPFLSLPPFSLPRAPFSSPSLSVPCLSFSLLCSLFPGPLLPFPFLPFLFPFSSFSPLLGLSCLSPLPFFPFPFSSSLLPSLFPLSPLVRS